MSFLKEYAQNIVIISILATIFEIIIPEGKNKKVAGITIGLVVMLTVMNPLKSLAQLNIYSKFPSFKVEENFSSYEKNIIADVFEENLATSIIEKTEEKLGKKISCRVITLRNESGEITEIESIYITPYDEETSYFIENEFSFDSSIIKGENND